MKKDNRYYSSLPVDKWIKVKHRHQNSSKFDLNNRLSNLQEVKTELDEEYVMFWLTDGTLLAAYRDKDFLKWDNEVDLDTFYEYASDKIDKLIPKFLDRNFIARYYKRKGGGKLNLFRGGEKVSLRLLFTDESYCKNKYRLSWSYRYPKKLYRNFTTIGLKGMTFQAPAPIDKYLFYVFGSTWTEKITDKVKVLKDLKKRGVLMPYEDRKRWRK